MPSCCRCNSSGHCRTCICFKSGWTCIDCLPIQLGNCENGQPNHPVTAVNEPRCLSEQSAPVNESQSFNDQTDPPQDASDFMVTRALATSTSEAAMATKRGNMYSLLSFSVVQEPNFMWAGVDGVSFTGAVDSVYTEVIHWHWNLFKVPSGKVGKAFVAE